MNTTKTPRIAVIGAGPIGLEAALRARAAGLDVVVMDSSAVGANVATWGFVEMFTPWAMNTTRVGRSAAGDDALLSSEQTPTGNEFLERYLLPIAQSDALAGCIDTGVRVLAVAPDKSPGHHGDAPGGPRSFQLLVCDQFGVEQTDHADVVLDCTGTYGNSRWTGDRGIPASGEVGVKSAIWYSVPDVLGRDRYRFAGRHTLLIGSGTSAATILTNLSRVASKDPATRVTWAVRRWGQVLQLAAEDPLQGRRALVENVLRLSATPPPWLTLIEDAHVERFSAAHGKSAVLRSGNNSFTCHADEIVAAIGYRPDESIFAPLGRTPIYANSEETRSSIQSELANHLGDGASRKTCPSHVVTVAPGCYVLGAKSYGTNSNFLLRVGHHQVRDVFRHILRNRQRNKNAVEVG